MKLVRGGTKRDILSPCLRVVGLVAKKRVAKTRVAKNRAAKVRAAEVRVAEVRVAEVRLAKKPVAKARWLAFSKLECRLPAQSPMGKT